MAIILLLATIVGLYSNARFGSYTTDSDATNMSAAANSILHTLRLVGERSYANGFAYPALLAFAGELGGLSPHALVTWGGVWVAVFALMAFLTYRELVGDPWLALLGTLLLFVYPDLMFYILRGGHERVTWLLALLMIFLLARSLRHAASPWRLIGYVSAFYLVFWGMASTNVYFGSTFASAILIAFVGSCLFGRLRRAEKSDEQPHQHLVDRLLVVSLACLVLVFVFINYTYRPALGYYYYLGDFASRAGSLLFGAQEETGPPAAYVYFGRAWRSTGTYLALVGLQFILAAVSFLRWLFDLRKLASFNDRRWFLWWLYAAFGGLLAFGVFADYAGFLQGNLQLRMFTPFVLFSALFAALALQAAYRFLGQHRRKLALALGGVVLVYGLLASLAKVTNDPLVSNVWFFYQPAEVQAGKWMNAHIENQVIWVDTWSRLKALFKSSEEFVLEWREQYASEGTASSIPFKLITENTRLSANRRGATLPAVYDHHAIYDNGAARLYYRRARTPYQR